jgi:hypothetical protein
MEIINWDNINQCYLQDIYSIHDTLANIEDEKEKIKQIYLILFSRYYLDIEIIKEHIKAYYFLEDIQYINIIDEVFNNIVIFTVYNNQREELEDDDQEELYDNNDEDNIEQERREDQIIQMINFINFVNEISNINNLEDVIMVLDENQLNNIPEKKYSEISTECNTCSICQDEIDKDHTVRQLNCNHIYHKECIDKYLLEYSYKCPICRAECGNGVVKN